MSDGPIDIHDPIYELCERLGLQPENVAKITFKPRSVEATVYLLNENGAKYLVDAAEILPAAQSDDVTGFSSAPAVEILTFAVTT